MSESVQHPILVVGIGASAGGLVAFKSFLSKVPANSGMAFVLVQHLAPHHKSLLVELLSAESPIPVVAASDGLAIGPNAVFVIPPDSTLTIRDGVLELTTPAPLREHRRPIDTFFTSLAEDCGERAVGIVLSGVGSDGTIGIRAIKEHGGLTLAQADIDAKVMLGMPSSAVSTGLVDHVLPAEAMAAKLIDYHRHLIAVEKRKDGDGTRRDLSEYLTSVTALVHAHNQHDFSGYKDATLGRRLQRRMQVLQIDHPADYVERMRTDPTEIEALFRDFLIGVTHFFRDPEAFDALKVQAILPMLTNKDRQEPVRVWVPGCSTGEEVYSIAILLRETLQTLDRAPDVKIFGTDIDANAVATARAGRYRKSVGGLSPERIAQWFITTGEDYVPVPALRNMCVFSAHSLVRDPPFSRLDLISCRNVMIYLDEELQDRVMRTFHYALLPGGTLFLGTAESVTRNSRLFTAIDKTHRILRRRDSAVGAAHQAYPPGDLSAQTTRTLPPTTLLPVRGPLADDRADRAISRVMQDYAPTYFVIDRNDEVTRFSGAETGHYLEPTQGAASLNLFSILHKSLRPVVRATMSQARAESHRVVNDNLTIRIDGKARALTLIVEPIAGDTATKGGSGCVIAFRDASSTASAPTLDASTSSGAAVQALERELAATKAQLQAASDELEMRIADMKSTTEEFQAVNEELQSSNEELETSKEEMQSINEELQTINAELNNKNELLTHLNSDVQNLLASTQIATVFLDGQLRIKHFTPTLTQLFPIRDSDRGRPFSDIVSVLDHDQLGADIERVKQATTSLIERDLTIKDSDKRFAMRVHPYFAAAGNVDGVVITFIDITERKKTELALSRLSTIVDSSEDAIISTDLLGVIQTWNAAALRMYGYTAQEAIGKPAAMLMPPDRENEEPDFLARIGGGELIDPYETVRVRKDGSLLDISLTVSPVRDTTGSIVGASKIARDITQRKAADAHRSLLTSELRHRTKNLLSVIQSIARRSLDSAETLGVRAGFLGRLRALGHANELLFATEWQGATLRDIVESSLEGFSGRYSIEGHHILLNAGAAQGFALVTHELSTNASKYGAFSMPHGHVVIRWSVDATGDKPCLAFAWGESGGPPVTAPDQESFGSKLLQTAIGGSVVQTDYQVTGLVYELKVPIEVVAEEFTMQRGYGHRVVGPTDQ